MPTKCSSRPLDRVPHCRAHPIARPSARESPSRRARRPVASPVLRLASASGSGHRRWPLSSVTCSGDSRWTGTPCGLLECGRVVSEQRFPHDLDGRRTLLQEIVVKALERECSTLFPLEVSTQLEDLELSERVIEIGRIRCAPLGLDEGDFARLVAFLYEEVDGLIKTHSAAMHLDPNYETGVSQQGILQLPKADQERVARVPCARAGLTVALIEHHLLRVVGPAFNVRRGSKKLADLGGSVVQPKKLNVVARVSLMNRCADDGTAIEIGHPLFHLLGGVLR